MVKHWNDLWIVLSDLHYPFQDEKLVQLILKFMKDITPSGVALNGDINDFFKLSRHDKSPTREGDLQYELDEVRKFFKQLRGVIKSDSKIVHIEGNHEERLRKYLASAAPELSSLRCLEFHNLMGHDIFDIEYVKDTYKLNKNFILRHGTNCGKYPARGALGHSLKSGSSGHAHKRDIAFMHGYEKDIVWHCTGHLSNRPKLAKACNHYEKGYNWDKSFLIVKTNRTDFHVEHIKVDKKGFYCNHNGKRYNFK